jgi:hypothetical protein
MMIASFKIAVWWQTQHDGQTKPFGVFLIAIFFAVASCILLNVGTALLLPGSKLGAIWVLYPARRSLLMPYRIWLGPEFLALAIGMIAASTGCFRQRKWGWWLAVGIFLVNGISDVDRFSWATS